MYLLAKHIPSILFLTAISITFYSTLYFSNPPPKENIYLLVSGYVPPSTVTTNNKLTSISDGNIVKNYFCKLSDSTVSDNTCSLYSLNTLNTSNKSIQLSTPNSKQLESSPLAISDSSYHILEIDKSLYQTIITKDLSISNTIELVDIHSPTKHFGKLKTLTPLTLYSDESLYDPKISIFLGRISSIHIPSYINTDKFTCSLLDKKHIPCNVFYLRDNKDTNNISQDSLSSITPLSLNKNNPNLIKDHYVIVDLLSNRTNISDLKKSPIQISLYDPLNPFNPFNENIINTIYDQNFFGHIDKEHLALSNLFTATPNKQIYISAFNEDLRSSLNGIDPKSSYINKPKNYRCKFSIEGKPDNFDDSCYIYPIKDIYGKVIYSFNEIIKDINPNTNILKYLNSKNLIGEFFNIEFDTNKVYILPQDPLALNSDISLEISNLGNEGLGDSADEEFTYKLKLLNQITKDQIVGNTSLIWAEVISDDGVLEGPIKDATCLFKDSIELVNCVIYKTYYSKDHSLIDDLMINSNHMTTTDNFVKGAKYLFRTLLPFNSKGVKGKEFVVSIVTVDGNIYKVRLKVLNTLGPDFIEGKKLFLFN